MGRDQRTWIEISGPALRHNLQAVQTIVGPQIGVMLILKANAYGHGLSTVLDIVRQQKHWGIGVAYGEEAWLVRELKYRGRIVVLSNWQLHDVKNLVIRNIELVVWDQVSLRAVIDLANKSKVRPKIHLKLDTGTSRIGFLERQLPEIERMLAKSSVKVVGVFSHFANAEEGPSRRTTDQLKRFTTLIDKTRIADDKQGIEAHIACTAAILRYPEAKFGLIRLGIGLYGLWPSAENRAWSRANIPALELQPVLSWYTRLIQVKTVPAGTDVGYGASYRTKKAARIGIIPVGYADGYDRRLSNRGVVYINGYRANVIGRVCMNLIILDLTHVPQARTGQLVQLIGPNWTVEDIAEALGTINYEVTTRINWSLPRYSV